MTTATTATPLETYRQGRDQVIAAIFDAVSGLEGAVLGFEHTHEGKVRAAGFELSQALSEQARLERLVGEQALELADSRGHVCPAPAFKDMAGVDPLDVTVTAPTALSDAPAAGPAADTEATGRATEDLRADLAEQQRINAKLIEDLAAERRTVTGLRADLAQRDQLVASLEEAAAEGAKNATAATETYQAYVRDAENTFNQRLAAGVSGVRIEAVRIIEAIAADNPALAEAADLFTEAFPAEAKDEAVAPAAPATAPLPEEDFLDAIPAPDTDTGPMTQGYLSAPGLGEDAILDPGFFDTPQTLDAPSGESIQAPTPHGIFGRKKESQNA